VPASPNTGYSQQVSGPLLINGTSLSNSYGNHFRYRSAVCADDGQKAQFWLTEIVRRKRSPIWVDDGRFRMRRPKLCSRHEGIDCAVRDDRTNGGKREVVAGNERLVGHGTVEQSAPRRLGIAT
jgi:hypothetical protein